MNTIGFIKSDKENENRIAIYPNDLKNIKNVNQVFIETGYGKDCGFSDEDYLKYNCNICSRKEILLKDIIVDPKIGDAQYLNKLHNQKIFGWIHAVQNKDIRDILINNKLTAYAWEDMYEDNQHVFWKNNELAGEIAVLHACMCHGILPYGKKVAILGNGNTAHGAYKVLVEFGADVLIYPRKQEEKFKKDLSQYDIIVNAILWDIHRKDHIIYRKDLKRMKKNALIVDISCDKNGGIETSIPTTIDNPIYIVDGITHYVVDHTPSLAYKTISEYLSKEVSKYVDFLIEDKYNKVLESCKIIEEGKILDQKIIDFMNK